MAAAAVHLHKLDKVGDFFQVGASHHHAVYFEWFDSELYCKVDRFNHMRKAFATRNKREFVLLKAAVGGMCAVAAAPGACLKISLAC